MTKLRTPTSFENALFQLLGALTIEVAAEVTGRSVSYLREAADEDKPQQLTLRDAYRLDVAHRAAGLGGVPIYEAYGRQLDCDEAARFATASTLGQHLRALLREGADAHLALADAATPGADRGDRLHAVRELEELDREVTRALAAARSAAGLAGQPPP
jgi:hypothetical protein